MQRPYQEARPSVAGLEAEKRVFVEVPYVFGRTAHFPAREITADMHYKETT